MYFFTNKKKLKTSSDLTRKRGGYLAVTNAMPPDSAIPIALTWFSTVNVLNF